jgi:HD-GYP domain-containing protein (c-di-GMP phosphodiesterase class II)
MPPAWEVERVRLGAMLREIGKVVVPDEIPESREAVVEDLR